MIISRIAIVMRNMQMVKSKGGYEVPEDMYFTEDFAWARLDGTKAWIGITDYAQKKFKKMVSVELEENGRTLKQNEAYGAAESEKSAWDLIAPLSGVIEDVNLKVVEDPSILNRDPYGDGWLILITTTNIEEEMGSLMNTEQAEKWYSIRAFL
jgi:glycine cleavage system H protein